MSDQKKWKSEKKKIFVTKLHSGTEFNEMPFMFCLGLFKIIRKNAFKN